MIEQIVKYYKIKVTTYGLVFKYMIFPYYLVLVLLIFSVIALLTFILNLLMIKQDAEVILHGIIFLALLFILSSITFNWFNKRAKKILKSKYKIFVTTKTWRTIEFDKLQTKKLMEYLELQQLNTPTKVTKLIEILNKDIERRKIPSLITPGVLLALFIPIWVQYLMVSFKGVTLNSEALHLLVIHLTSVLIIITAFNFLRWITTELIDVLVLNDVTLRKRLIEKLEEITLLLPKED